ncbi:hypothetical protein CASFOL_040877 [Castilleja foliolosa]|uniref:MADS-box domain-containing protein n=1 Tax=Castilleja foliolosa TaxID=1961234 RepID=A0ABD3BCU7_9LAMI
MARNKKTLACIADPAERMAMYENLMKDVEKKVRDLRRFHGVDLCVITYRPDGSGPDVWPSQAGAEAEFNHLTMAQEKEAESVSGQAAAASTSEAKVVEKDD